MPYHRTTDPLSPIQIVDTIHRLVNQPARQLGATFRPRIGITTACFPNQYGRFPSIGQNKAYAEAVWMAGGEPVLLSFFALSPGSDSFEASWGKLQGLHGILLTGGEDLDPRWYGESLHPQTQNQDATAWRDWWEWHLARLATTLCLPVFAICRGMQIWNVALGGTLWQDLHDLQIAVDERTSRRGVFSPKTLVRQHAPAIIDVDRYRRHPIVLEESGAVARWLTTAAIASVASMHHQAVRTPAPLLRVSGTSFPPYPVIEVLERRDISRSSFGIGTQFHPEEDQEQAWASRLFQEFVRAARQYASSRFDELERYTEAIARIVCPPHEQHEGEVSDAHARA